MTIKQPLRILFLSALLFSASCVHRNPTEPSVATWVAYPGDQIAQKEGELSSVLIEISEIRKRANLLRHRLRENGVNVSEKIFAEAYAENNVADYEARLDPLKEAAKKRLKMLVAEWQAYERELVSIKARGK